MKAIIAAMAIASLAHPALAKLAQQSMTVKISDLNLASEADKKALALRIHRAAKLLCESEVLSQSPQMQRAERHCVDVAKASAIATVERKTGVQPASR
jgi:UrcA family protein